MTQTKPALSAETGGTEITRFNAIRHGVLSRYTVLPWEDADVPGGRQTWRGGIFPTPNWPFVQ
jgi:hypothetical protein